MPTALICGVTGQDGAHLAKLLLDKGYAVFGTSRDAQVATLDRLQRVDVAGRIQLETMMPTDFRSVIHTQMKVKADEIYYLAGQSSVGLSFAQPVEAWDSIALGTLNQLEAIRILGRPVRFYNACSSECFGNVGGPANESTPFAPRSPYGVAKAASFWSVANYREAYGLYACSGILFNHESALRPARFVTQKIVRAAVRIAAGDPTKLELGNIAVQRDWGWAPEYVDAMWRMLQGDRARDYVIATGECHRLEDFVAEAFARVGLDWRDHVTQNPAFFRPTDIDVSLGDPALAAEELGWVPRYRMVDVVREMVDAEWQRACPGQPAPT